MDEEAGVRSRRRPGGNSGGSTSREFRKPRDADLMDSEQDETPVRGRGNSRGRPRGNISEDESPEPSDRKINQRNLNIDSKPDKPLLKIDTTGKALDDNSDNEDIDDRSLRRGGRGGRGGKKETLNEDIETGKPDLRAEQPFDPLTGPMNKLEPIRTDPISTLQSRQRRLDRLSVTNMPEVHYVGQIASGLGLIEDTTEGAFCRWKIEYGQAWDLLGGDINGQTQVTYCQVKDTEFLPFNHPIDLHFAEAGLQGFGAPRISFQSYRMDMYGRRILVGYGFVHLPLSPGFHRIEIPLWRPTGSPEQELDGFLLGRMPALLTHQPIYETAWKDRCRLVTIAAGKIYLELFVVTRNMHKQGIDL